MNNNYTYIIASLAFLNKEYKPSDKDGCRENINWILSQLSKKDNASASLLLQGFVVENLHKSFYERALSSGNLFIRGFFSADLELRNAKVEYLNRSLGRAKGSDVISIENAPEGRDAARIEDIFKTDDLLGREKAIDWFLWDKADELTLFKDFTLENVLAVLAKLCIIQRWLALDGETGRIMLRRLVGDVRGTYGKIEFETLK